MELILGLGALFAVGATLLGSGGDDDEVAELDLTDDTETLGNGLEDFGGSAQVIDETENLETPSPKVVFEALDAPEWDVEDYTVLTPDQIADIVGKQEEPLVVQNSPSADQINAGDISYGLIFAGNGDLVAGSDEADELYDFAVIAEGEATVEGGAGDEVIVSLHDGGTLEGGEGDDLVMSDSGSTTISGGEGDDTLVGNAESQYYHSATKMISQYQTDGADSISGGEGDDYIVSSDGDTVHSGSGADTISVFGGNVEILDFDESEDVLVVEVPGGDPLGNPETDPSYNLDDRLSLERSGEILDIHLDGESIMSIRCGAETSVAYYNNLNSDELHYLSGDSGEATPSITISVFQQIMS